MKTLPYFLSFLLVNKAIIVYILLYLNLGMFGFDSYIHLQYVEAIVAQGKIMQLDIVKSYYDFAGFHAFIASVSALTGYAPHILYESLSVLIPLLLCDLLFIGFIRYNQKKQKGYILSEFNVRYFSILLLFPALLTIELILARPNTLGIALFLLCTYLYICKADSFRAQILASVVAIATLKVHHLSAVFLIPIILYTSIFLATNYYSIFSFIYAIPTVMIVQTILESREFNIVNLYFSQNENYVKFYEVFIENTILFLFLWVLIMFSGFFIRKKLSGLLHKYLFYEEESEKGSTNRIFLQYQMIVKRIPNFNILVFRAMIGITILIQIIGLLFYANSLSSWFIIVELMIIFLIGAFALYNPNNMKFSLFLLSLVFYGLTVLFSLSFSTISSELSWVAPRTFTFSIVIIAVLAYITTSEVLERLKQKWIVCFLFILLFNASISLNYTGNQYIPGYNIANDYQNISAGMWIEHTIDKNGTKLSIPFSVGKFLKNIDLYSLPILISVSLNESQNYFRLIHSGMDFILIGSVMDQWLGPPYYLSTEELLYYINQNKYNVIFANGKYYLLGK